MRIDSHHHFWQYDPAQYGWINESMGVLRQDYLPQRLRTVASEAGVSGVVSVQARQTIEETEWLLKFAQEYELVLGVVGWAPFASHDVAQKIEEWSHHSWLKSLRHVVQDEADGFLDAPDFNQGIEVLKRYDFAYDLLIYGHQLQEAIRFVDRHPNTRMILDHIAKPKIQSQLFDEVWEKDFRELAKRANVACKFSGIATEIRDSQWSIETLQRYWDVAIDAFGPSRLMFGSDWPVCLLRVEYGQWVKLCEQLTSTLSIEEQNKFWQGNAVQWYQL